MPLADLGRAELSGLILAFGGFAGALFGGFATKKDVAIFVSALTSLVLGLGLLIWPENDHQGEIDFTTLSSQVKRCVEVSVKAPSPKGETLWLADSSDGSTWILQPARRGQVQDDGRFLWQKALTIGPEKAPAGVQYRVEAFFLSGDESAFIQGIQSRTSSGTPRSQRTLSLYWTARTLPAGVPDNPAHITLTRRDGVSEPHC